MGAGLSKNNVFQYPIESIAILDYSTLRNNNKPIYSQQKIHPHDFKHSHKPYLGTFVITPLYHNVLNGIKNEQILNYYQPDLIKLACEIDNNIRNGPSMPIYWFNSLKQSLPSLFPGHELFNIKNKHITPDGNIDYLILALTDIFSTSRSASGYYNNYHIYPKEKWKSIYYRSFVSNSARSLPFSSHNLRSKLPLNKIDPLIAFDNIFPLSIPKKYTCNPLNYGLVNVQTITLPNLIHALSRLPPTRPNSPAIYPACFRIVIPADFSDFGNINKAVDDIKEHIISGGQLPLLQLNVHLYLVGEGQVKIELLYGEERDQIVKYFTDIGFSSSQIIIHPTHFPTIQTLKNELLATTEDDVKGYIIPESDESTTFMSEIVHAFFQIQLFKSQLLDSASKLSYTPWPNYQSNPCVLASHLEYVKRSFLREDEKIYNQLFSGADYWYDPILVASVLNSVYGSNYKHNIDQDVTKKIENLQMQPQIYKSFEYRIHIPEGDTTPVWLFSDIKPILPRIQLKDTLGLIESDSDGDDDDNNNNDKKESVCEKNRSDYDDNNNNTNNNINCNDKKESNLDNSNGTDLSIDSNNNNNESNNNINVYNDDENVVTPSVTAQLFDKPIPTFKFDAFICNRYYLTQYLYPENGVIVHYPHLDELSWFDPRDNVINALNAVVMECTNHKISFKSTLFSIFPSQTTPDVPITYESPSSLPSTPSSSSPSSSSPSSPSSPSSSPPSSSSSSVSIDKSIGNNPIQPNKIITMEEPYTNFTIQQQCAILNNKLSPTRAIIKYLFRHDNVLFLQRHERTPEQRSRVETELMSNIKYQNNGIHHTVWAGPMNYLYGVHLFEYNHHFTSQDGLSDNVKALSSQLGIPDLTIKFTERANRADCTFSSSPTLFEPYKITSIIHDLDDRHHNAYLSCPMHVIFIIPEYKSSNGIVNSTQNTFIPSKFQTDYNHLSQLFTTSPNDDVLPYIDEYRNIVNQNCKSQLESILDRKLVSKSQIDDIWHFHVIAHKQLPLLLSKIQFQSLQKRLKLYARILEQ